MQKVKKLLFLYLSLLAIICAIVYFFSWTQSSSTPTDLKTSTSSHALIQAATEIEQYWQSGLWPNELRECTSLIELLDYLDKKEFKKERYLQCEPLALACYLESIQKQASTILTADRVEWNIHSRSVEGDQAAVIRYHEDREVNEASKLIFFELFEPKNKITHLFSLEDSCLDRRLREDLHPYGEQRSTGQDFIWDNRNRALYVDRFLVSKGDFYDWVFQQNQSHPFPKADKPEGLQRFLIADRVPLEWQRRYCEAHGKTLLQSHVADAASFYPAQLESDQIMIYPRGPYPQGRRKLDSYLGEILTNEVEDIDTSRLCHEVFTEECLKEHEYLLARLPFGLSSQGMEQVLGGMPESTMNKIEPLSRVHLSSIYFSYKSDVHRLGKRFQWDGESFKSSSFNLAQELPEQLGIGFRCMKVSKR
jgi:hypothetical protein